MTQARMREGARQPASHDCFQFEPRERRRPRLQRPERSDADPDLRCAGSPVAAVAPSHPNPVTTAWSFDSAGFLSSVTSLRNGTTLDSHTYLRDAVGNITQETISGQTNSTSSCSCSSSCSCPPLRTGQPRVRSGSRRQTRRLTPRPRHRWRYFTGPRRQLAAILPLACWLRSALIALAP
jgi:hypothetical protein